ncbi:mismatch-specific DNA-glycosylase [Paenibacillus ginsengihumi]|uniref:mismatch-specific DNA-glycosylase n=1 Tax=Paenibacillus ginsengihumi TaxID=431596 RepID=UPI000360E189|nr:mismatch-specific DNA-glycosylase [Paenibacillus ginsengihumi]
MKEIPDHLRQGLDLLFVGFNPSLRSGETGHHYANPNNRFWKIIHEAGLTNRRYRAEEDGELLEHGIGFTNIVPRPTKTAAEITKEEYRLGAEALRDKIACYRPKVVCYVGKGVYEQLSGRKGMDWGKQDEPVVPGVIDFVAPSSSGLVRMPLAEIVSIYAQLKALI